MKQTIVSITPVSLDCDSRSLKIARSFAQWGFESIVVEGKKSCKDFSHLGIKIISLQNSLPAERIIEFSPHKTSLLLYFLNKAWWVLKKLNISFVLNTLSFLYFKYKFNKKYVNDIESKIPDASLYYLHSYEYFTSIKKKLRKGKAKLIYDAHDFYTKIDPKVSFLGDKSVHAFCKKLEGQVIKEADTMISVSQGLQNEYFRDFQRSPSVLYNAHDCHIDTKPKISLREQLTIDKSCILAVVIGNWKKGQANEQIISAFLKLPPQFHLVFIGAGYDRVQQKFSTDKENRLHFLSRIAPNIIVPLAQECDFGILPYYALSNNYKYALPNGFFQMIAAKLPILYSKDMEEICKLNQVYQFGQCTDFFESEAVEESLKSFSSEHTKPCYEKALKIAYNELSWQNEERKLQKIIAEEKLLCCSG